MSLAQASVWGSASTNLSWASKTAPPALPVSNPSPIQQQPSAQYSNNAGKTLLSILCNLEKIPTGSGCNGHKTRPELQGYMYTCMRHCMGKKKAFLDGYRTHLKYEPYMYYSPPYMKSVLIQL